MSEITERPQPLHDMAVHRAAFQRFRRLRRIDTALWLSCAGLGGAALLTAVPWYAAGAGTVTVLTLLWRWTGHRDTATAWELQARRDEFGAYYARQRARDAGAVPDPRTEPECARLCAAIDELEATLPWWHRTT